MKPKRRKERTVSSLKKRAWNVFSEYIRLRDCLATTGAPFESKCVTCENFIPNSKGRLHAGHWISRVNNATLFDERNCFAQCAHCNLFNEGSKPEFSKFILDKFGQKVYDDMITLSKTTKRFTIEELQELIQVYKQKIKELENE